MSRREDEDEDEDEEMWNLHRGQRQARPMEGPCVLCPPKASLPC